MSCLHTDLVLAQCQGEVQRAADIRQRIENEWPLRPADEVTDFVRRFGHQLAVRSGTGRQSWRFNVVRDLHPNAYSIGDGSIYLTEGALLLARDETELAAMIAHEMGHQLAGHFCPQQSRNGSWLDWMPNIFAPQSGGTAKGEVRDGERVYKGTLRQGWDPEKEREADGYARRLLYAAGYDAGAIERLEWRLRTAAPPFGGGNDAALPENGWTNELRRIQQQLRRTALN